MSKLADFFKNFRKRYDAQILRNEKIDEFLVEAKEQSKSINTMTNAITTLTSTVETLSGKVDQLSKHMKDIDTQLDTISKGTKIELLETLHNWKLRLVKRGWKTKEEMSEVKDIYELYNKKLHGNGQGTAYYNEVQALEERELS